MSKSTAGLTKATADGHGYSGEVAWVTADGALAFVSDGRPFGAAVLTASTDGNVTIGARRYCETWEAESISAARAHHNV